MSKINRNDFPILKQKVDGHPLIYFDNAATTQKPQQVLDVLFDFYTKHNANIHRGVHSFGEMATLLYEETRKKVATFIGADDPAEIIFTRGTTESINFVASTWAQQHISPGDEIVLTEMEHHANLVPWQQLAFKKNATLKFIPVRGDGILDLTVLPNLLTSKTKLVAIIHISNALGTVNNVKAIFQSAHKVGAKTLLDGAQSVPHHKIDVTNLDCDFLAFSGHKMLAPTGVGVLYIKKDLFDDIPPYHFGGGMIFDVDLHKATWLPSPHKYEAGTPPIAQVVGLGAAIDYLDAVFASSDNSKYEATLTARAIDGLSQIPSIKLLGPLEQLKKTGHLISFLVDGIHSHDTAAYLSSNGVCVRAGHHCAQPLAKQLGIEGSIRASFYLYNTIEEVDAFLEVMDKLIVQFKG